MGFLERIMGIQTTPDLTTCEKRIQRGLDSYRDAGDALQTIRDARLYRTVADTFENYCRMRWQMEPQHAGRLIAAADVAKNLEPTGSIPKNEKTARALAMLDADDQLEAWAEAKQLAAPNDPTSTEVAGVVAKRRKPNQKRKAKPIRMKLPTGIIIIEPGRNYVSEEKILLEALAKLGVVIEAASEYRAA